MANDYFSFKQFTVRQGNCAMKVCTDACLFGAHVGAIAGKLGSLKYGLDIGTGTGLLSLMVAQKNPDILIDAVEIDALAAEQAAENFRESPWKDRLEVHQHSIQSFAEIEALHQYYDLIICNPPFFENDLKSSDSRRNLALHSAALTLEDLLAAVKQLLKPSGIFALLLPFHRSMICKRLCSAYEFYPMHSIYVRKKTGYPFFRTMIYYSNAAVPVKESAVVIKDEQDRYTKEFSAALEDYYL